MDDSHDNIIYIKVRMNFYVVLSGVVFYVPTFTKLAVHVHSYHLPYV